MASSMFTSSAPSMQYDPILSVEDGDYYQPSTQKPRAFAIRLGLIGAAVVVLCSGVALTTTSKQVAVPMNKTTKLAFLEGLDGIVKHPVGGLSPPETATEEVDQMLEPLKDAILARAKSSGFRGEFSDFEAVSYRTQVVAGTNYFIKVRVGSDAPDAFLHVRVFQPLPYTNEGPQVHSVKIGKKFLDDIEGW